MTPGPDSPEGAPPVATQVDADVRDTPRVEAAAPLAPTSDGILADALDLRVREHRSAFKRATSAAAPPSGMATDAQVEAFRDLRTQLMLLAAGAGLTHFTTMVVPLTEGSGSSFVARNLAAAFTLQQRLALLVDCNFRNATQHEVLGVSDGVEGLFEFLGEPAEVPLDRLIRPTPLPGLHVIPAGRSDAMVAGPVREQFSSRRMKSLISILRHEPCYVFLDGPPVEGSPDARILSDLADFVVLVVGYGRATAKAIARAASLFEKRKFAGVVFNELARAKGPERPRREVR